MKKILVLSDSHGRSGKVKKMIAENLDLDGIIYLGDGERDLETGLSANGFAKNDTETCERDGHNIFLYQVRGNCDRESIEAVTLIREIAGIKFYITHGFEQGVKFGLEKLSYCAEEADCRVALFGHTHGMHLSELGGVTLFNPGSAANGNYGMIIVDEGNLSFKHCSL